MKRQIDLPAAAQTVLTGGSTVFPGSSGYINQNTPKQNLAVAWSDGINSTYWASAAVFGPTTGRVSFAPAPTLVTFTKITLRTAWDYGQGGANSWFFPPQNNHGPILTMHMLGRAGAQINGPSHQISGSDIGGMNVNFNTNPGVWKLHAMEWELLSHPEGGPFTLDDINALQTGVSLQTHSIRIADGSKKRPFQPTGFEQCRVPYFQVLIDVIDLGGFIENVRNSTSTSLRWFRRARNAIEPESFADRAIGNVGSRVYLSHPRGPSVGGNGWGKRRLERRSGLLLKRKILPESFKIRDEIFDLRAYQCLGWAAYRIDGAWSPEIQGLALVDKGEGYTHTRDQDGWSQRPGDGVLMRVIENYPNVSFHGLAAQGGGDDSICFRNYTVIESGWSTVASSGEYTATTEAKVYLVEEQGFVQSAKLVYGPAGGQGGQEQNIGTLPFASGDFLHLRIIIKNTSVPTPGSQNAEWGLRREGGGLGSPQWWDDATRTWTTETNNAIPSDAPFGEVVVDAIPLDAGGASSDPTYHVRIGRFSADLLDVTFNAALVDIQHTDSTTAGARTPIITLDAPVTRVEDVHRMVNGTGDNQLWDYTRGVAVVEIQPFWRADDLPTDQVRPLIHAFHETDSYDAIQFVAKTGSDDFIRFERAVSGEATFTLDSPIPSLDITRAHVLRAWARWLGADGWTEYAPWSVEVGWAVLLETDGSLVATGSALGVFTFQGDVSARDWIGIGSDSTRFLDAYVRMWETRRNPIDGLEAIWRI
jgi:hypothetical protein